MAPTAAQQPEQALNPQHLDLSPRQEELLVKALISNKASNVDKSPVAISSMALHATDDPPTQTLGSGSLSLDDSPFIDYDYEFDAEGNYDYEFAPDSQGQMIGNMPGSSSDGDAENHGDVEHHDKRRHTEDDEAADEDESGGGKRRGGEDKSSKKPGRKPLTSEPTSKRKAQNRAAQRAFRERKEKHLKDLETRNEDLQKASEAANHENAILRAQLQKMEKELRDARTSLHNMNRGSSLHSGPPTYHAGQASGGALHNPSDVNFSFEFPKFGRLPGPPSASSGTSRTFLDSTKQSTSPQDFAHQYINERDQISPREQSLQSFSTSETNAGVANGMNQLDEGDMSSLSGLFSPSILNSVSKSPSFDYFPMNGSHGSRSSTDSNGNKSGGLNTAYSSPSSSSNGQQGSSSSCGTSPEPVLQSPSDKAVDVALSTIGEEHGEGNIETPSYFNGIDWFAQQNGNQFDPQLFGDYREPQENILSGEGFSDSFFVDAYAIPDFNSTFNVAPSPAPPKIDLMAQIEEKVNEDDNSLFQKQAASLLSCNTIWDRLQALPKLKEGDFDLDLLCKDLQKKAVCSETGAVVKESDFKKILSSYVHADGTIKTLLRPDDA